MFNPKIIKTDYVLGADQGDSRIAQRKYIIAHESGYDPDTKKPNMLLNEVQNMSRNLNVNKAYVTHFVGYMDNANEAQIYQIGEPGYVSWGALSANPYAPVQIEFARIYQNNKDKFKKAYHLYVDALRYFANLYGIPCKLDESGNGIKTHQWVTNNYGGDHVDPYGYFESMGISRSQFKHDVENGITETVVNKPVTKSHINNIVQVLGKKVGGYTTYELNGKANETTDIIPNSRWVSNAIEIINNEPMYCIGGDIYIPQSVTTLANKAVVNSNMSIDSLDKNGKANGKLNAGSDWKYSALTNIPNVGYCYQIATDMFLPIKFTVGSVYKG